MAREEKRNERKLPKSKEIRDGDYEKSRTETEAGTVEVRKRNCQGRGNE
ncbi:hypothetical protein CCACVL1_01716 [Corchorus capsularis]|uniref:Uncharacterized protein n=1 Tax=Corchorus capsularis TaxID=210143 RepID=A0A1R3KG75_COCAP|nr:hypothetical protein CCACVL1_01716 [Corchorus capsularis]